MNRDGDYPNPFDTDSAWRELNGDPENLNRHLRRRARIGPPPETVLERQFQVGVAMAEKLEGLLAIYLAFLSGVPDDPAPPARPAARAASDRGQDRPLHPRDRGCGRVADGTAPDAQTAADPARAS